MKSFQNVKSLTIKDLEESGQYTQELLKALQEGKYQEIYRLSISDRSNQDFMEPLLYAVKNDKGTYAIYAYYSETLQDNIVLATEIIKTQPELLEGTPVSRNREFVVENIKENPEIAKYINPSLKNDTKVIEEIYKTGNELAIQAILPNEQLIIAITQTPELSCDKAFMLEKIGEFGEAIQFASEQLKNDYDFLKEAYRANIDAIDYTAEHAQEFGEKGLLAAKEVAIETTSDNAINGFQDELSKVRTQIEAYRAEPTSKNDDAIKKLEMDEKKFQRHIRFIQKIQSGAVDQVKAAERINKYCANLAPEYRKRIEQVLTINTVMQQKQQEGIKKVGKADIGEVARDFGKMEGKLPQTELQELKSAIEEPINESEIETETQEQE